MLLKYTRLASIFLMILISYTSAQTTVSFSVPSGSTLTDIVSDGEFGSNDVPGLDIDFFTSNTDGTPTGQTFTYYNAPLRGGMIGNTSAGDPAFIIRESNGYEFNFSGIYLAEWAGGNFNIRIEGRRDGISTGSIVVSTAGDSEEMVDLSKFPSFMFQNVDEVLLTNVSNAYSVSTLYLLYDQFSIEEAMALPVEFIHLGAKLNSAGKVEVEWETGSESNNDYFEVQRKSNIDTWKAIERIVGAGTTSLTSSYQILDNHPGAGKMYYRIKQVDLNGEYSYSDIFSVLVPKESNQLIYYNNANQSIHLDQEHLSSCSIRIFNQAGNIVLDQSNVDESIINVSFLPTGNYILYSLINGSFQYIKFSKSIFN